MLVSVGAVVIAAVIGVAVTPLDVATAGGAPVVAPTVAADVVPVAPVETALRKTASSVLEPPVTTGVGAELMEAFTVTCGLAYADGGTS